MKLPYPSIGQRVVCIDDRWDAPFPIAGIKVPSKGDVLTIDDVNNASGYTFLGFEEMPDWQRVLRVGFIKDFFRPVKETDVSDFLALQNPTPDQIEALRRHDAQRWSVPVKETT